nr:MAG TPA: hypothetical protein [Caudoviricetes sp.]
MVFTPEFCLKLLFVIKFEYEKFFIQPISLNFAFLCNITNI